MNDPLQILTEFRGEQFDQKMFALNWLVLISSFLIILSIVLAILAIWAIKTAYKQASDSDFSAFSLISFGCFCTAGCLFIFANALLDINNHRSS